MAIKAQTDWPESLDEECAVQCYYGVAIGQRHKGRAGIWDEAVHESQVTAGQYEGGRTNNEAFGVIGSLDGLQL
jgi:hypothetical protein